ncbi:PHD-finger domain-containing protein [Diaporthe helianthi]|uniref:PHD-finger domain-containing protein n=1 Tax=Diaporthe helianthi TaxID=158607 RepID=A0A2P5IC63_DIAHE|nr:PHD-finger domain-containing protein [Diaporthe helianthi]
MAAVEGGVMEMEEEEQLSPRQKASSMHGAIKSLNSISNGSLEALEGRADPDAQATVTDFLEFTEHLPADVMRSLTLIGTLDQQHSRASLKLHELARQWGQLPGLAPEEKPQPIQLRAEISEELNRVMTSRVYSHAEAVRMAENVNRHVNRLTLIHAKLRNMLEKYPADDVQRSPIAARSPFATRGAKRQPAGAEKGRRPRGPRITVPGDVLAPYDVGYDTNSDESESSSEEDEEEELAVSRRTPAVGGGSQKQRGGRKMPEKMTKTPKSKNQKALQAQSGGAANTPAGLPSRSAPLVPPPENAVIGSEDAPWLQLTQWELSKLRKRMKKNSSWVPSETMIHKELKTLGRGYDGWATAKKQAEDEGRHFETSLPQPIIDDATGSEHLPMGAVTLDSAIAAEDRNLTNRGHELNKAKKIKKDRMSDIAAKEAEESVRRFALMARNFQVSFQQPQSSEQATNKASSRRQQKKRKRDSVTEADAEKPDTPSLKRSKTETPVPIPPHINMPRSQQTSVPPPQLTPGGSQSIPQSTTPVPIPMPPGQEQSIITVGTKSAAVSPAPSADVSATTTIVPTKAPADDGPQSPIKSTTPIVPPGRETRAREAKNQAKEKAAGLTPIRTSVSRGNTPSVTTPGPESSSRRPSSRGQDATQSAGLAADRPRRASTARNTPAPEPMSSVRQPSKRTKRPAPGIISRTNSGGNSAITKRKAAPKKSKRGGARKKDDRGAGQASAEAEAEVEVDEDGNVIDPQEQRYCVCNRVSFGTMVLCENVDCPYEWFHLECLGLKTEKNLPKLWYCPECRVSLGMDGEGREGGKRTSKR